MGAITAEVVDIGEKRDSRGRRVLPMGERRRLIEGYQASGLSMAQYARREGINYSTMAGWMHRERPAEGGSKKTAIAFARVEMPAAVPRSAKAADLEVRLPDGTLLRGGRVADLVALVKALRS